MLTPLDETKAGKLVICPWGLGKVALVLVRQRHDGGLPQPLRSLFGNQLS
jgi:hypothetical protein